MEINALTILGDEPIKNVKTSIYSFIQTNKWFEGDLYVLVDSSETLSEVDMSDLLTIYQRTKILEIEELDNLLETIEKNTGTSVIEEILKLSIAFTNSQKILYFSSSMLFLNSIDSIFSQEDFSWIYSSSEKGSPQLIYLSDKIELTRFVKFNRAFLDSSDFLNLLYSEFKELRALSSFEGEFLTASDYSDLKFIQRKNDFLKAKAIYFNVSQSNSKRHYKINQVWIQQSHMMTKLLQRPSFRRGQKILKTPTDLNNSLEIQSRSYPNMLDSLNSISSKPSILGKKNDTYKSPNRLTPKESLYDYLNNKKIAIVANSSALLDENHGDLIDSHDVVIRFNGYSIESSHTGKKTNIHFIFREARFNLNHRCDYLFVVSNPVELWKNAIREIKTKNPSKNIIDFNFPTPSQITSAFGRRIIPTSGMCSILFIDSLNLEKYEINLFGFNGYSGGKSSILRSNNSDAISTVHDYVAEQNYIKSKFYETGPNIFTKIKS